MKFDVHVDDKELKTRIGHLRTAPHDPRLWNTVGHTLRAETLRCFRDQQAPDGTPWKPLSQRTIDMRRKGPKKNRSVQILRDTGTLMNSIGFRSGNGWCECGTNVEYAKKHQFGIGVPARPFLGLSEGFVRRTLMLLSEGVRRAWAR